MKTINPATAHVSGAALARLLTVGDRTVRRLVADGTIPAPTDGRYALAGCVGGYIAHLRQRKDGASLISARKRKLLADAELSELNVSEKRGRLVDVDSVFAAWYHASTPSRASYSAVALTRI